MPTAQDATAQLARQQNGGGQIEKRTEGTTLVDLLKSNEKEIAAALPSAGVTPKQLIRVAVTCVKQNPKLAQCTPHSVAGALMQAAHVGLLPGGTLGHAHLVPYWNPKERVNEAQFQIGWQGLIQLARRSGEVAEVWADVIHENDTWEIKRGLDRDLIHEPAYGEDRGEVRFAYAVVKYNSGARDWVVLDRDELEKRKQQSQTGRKGFGPWVDHFEAMCRKSAIKALAPFLPLTLDDARAFGTDGSVVRFDADDPGNLEDVERDEPWEATVTSVERHQDDTPAAGDLDTAADTPADDEDPAPPVDTETGEVDLTRLTKAKLVLRCHKAGLDTEGTKDELIARLRGGGDNGAEDIPSDDTPAADIDGPAPEQGNSSGSADLPEEPETVSAPDDTEDDHGEGVDDALLRRRLFARFQAHGVTEEQRTAVMRGLYGVESHHDLDPGDVELLLEKLSTDEGANQFKRTADDWLAGDSEE